MRILALLLLSVSSAFAQGTVIATNTWTNPSQTNSIAGMSNQGYHGSVYDDDSKLNCTWGAVNQSGAEFQHAWLCYSVKANMLFPMAMNHASATSHWGAAGHQNGGVAYVPGKGLISYVGDGSGNLTYSNSFLGHLWQFDTVGMTGRDISTLARPWLDGTPAGGWAYSASVGKILMYPSATPGVRKNGEYDPATNSYSLNSNDIGQLGNFNLWENPDTPGVMWMYDGTNIRKYTFSTGLWATVTTTCTGAACVSGRPPSRYGQFAAYSTVDHLAVMGGGTSTPLSGTIYGDTYTFDHVASAWVQLAASGTYPNDWNTNWNTFTFDKDSNVFVLMPRALGGTAMRLFALSTPLGYGRTPVTPTVTAGQLNRGTAGTTWAAESAIATNGSNIYIAHQESCPSCASVQPHTYVTSTPNTGAFTNLPTGAQTAVYSAIDSEFSADTYTGKIRLAHINGSLWALNDKVGYGSNNKTSAAAKVWTGSAWSGGFIGCFISACVGGGNYTQQAWGIIGVGTVPHVVLTEHDATNGQAKLVVAKYTGSWAQVGSTLNVGGTSIATGSRALSAAITTDGSNPSVCWAEEVINGTDRSAGASVSSQIYCKTWTGAAWGTQWTGAGLNIGASTTNSFANDPSVIYAGGNYYVAWTERTLAGVNKLYAAKWNGTTFTQLGSVLNIDTSTGWAFRPQLATDGTDVWVGWEEQQAIGQHALAYVKKWSVAGSSWSTVGGAIAADTTNGSVDGINIAMVGSSPTLVFSELNYASARSIYVRQWNGAAWSATLGVPATPTYSIPLTVQETLFPGSMSGLARSSDPVSAGVPLAQGLVPCGGSGPGTCTGLSNLTLTEPAAGQFRCLGVWTDNSCKWLKVTTVASPTAGGTATVTLTDAGAGNFGGSNLAVDNGTTITVTTGTATFTVKKANFNGLDVVDVGATHLVLTGASAGVVLLGPDPTATYPGNVTCLPTSGGSACTTVYASSNDASSTCTIEENGPVMAILKCDGSLIDGAAHSYLKHTTRLTFWKNKSYVKPVVILRNADYGASNTFATAYKGYQALEFRIAMNLSGTLSYSVANHTGTPTTGTMSGTDSTYIYVAETSSLKAGQTATSWCVGYTGCVIPTSLTGYVIMNNGSAVVTGTSTQFPQGWADIDNGSGVGVQVGHYQMASLGNKSLEFRGGGADVRVGLWAGENNTTSLATTTPNAAYYIPWPQHDIQEAFLNFHAAAPASLPNDFLKYQHYLVARASIAQYNSTAVFQYPLLDPTEEDAYYAATVAAASPSVSSYTVHDQGTTTNPWYLKLWRYYAWPSGGGANQMEFRLSYLFNFLRRGYTGQYLEAASFYKMQAERSFPQSDGFDWRAKPAGETQHMNFPTATRANSSLGMDDWIEVGMEHAHGYGMMDYYWVTGDETIKDVLTDAVVDWLLDTGSTNNLITAGKMWNARAAGNVLMWSARMYDFMLALNDSTTADSILARGNTTWTTQIKPDLCVTNTPAGCTVGTFADTFSGAQGTSRTRGITYQYSQGIQQGGGCTALVRAAAPFQISILLQGMWEYRKIRGSGWADYTTIFDTAYGIAQWALTEGYGDNGSLTSWSGNGYRYYLSLDTSNSCDTDNYPTNGRETVYYPFFITQQYSGASTWKRLFKQVVQRNQFTQGIDENFHYTIANTIYQDLHPDVTLALQTAPITSFADNGGGSYTIGWTTPSGTTATRAKWGAKAIVDWIGFDAGSNAFTGSPTTTQNWWASTEISTMPSPVAGTQTKTVTGLSTGLTSDKFLVKVMAPAGSAGTAGGAVAGGKISVGGRVIW